MVDQHPHYLLKKRNVFYYSRRIPVERRQVYGKSRLVFSLETGSYKDALALARCVTARLNADWECNTLPNGLTHKIETKLSPVTQEPDLLDARDGYLRIRGEGRPDTFRRAATRNLNAVVETVGNKPLTRYSSLDAVRVRDSLLQRGLTVISVRRMFATINAAFNFANSEYGIDTTNPFASVNFPPSNPKKRLSIPVDLVREIQRDCLSIGDDLRLLVALISDTGMRLSEAAGLCVEDVYLEDDIPHVSVQAHPWRPLKTRQSQRLIPLVGASLAAAKNLMALNQDRFCFPRYTNEDSCNGNSASAALNKWLKSKYGAAVVMHGFRHAFRDRLRAIDCPTELIDQLGGWSANNVGRRYGNGYDLDVLRSYLLKFTYSSKC